MKSYSFLVAAMLVVALLVGACGSTAAPAATSLPAEQPTEVPASAGEPVKIGAVFSLTGELASIGVPDSNGAQIAVDELNAKGGILGRPVELLLRDSKTDPVTTSTAGTELVEVGKVDAMIGLVDSDLALALGPICQTAGIPYVSSGATSPKLPSQIGNTFFMVAFGDNTQAAAAAEYAYNELGARKVYILWEKGIEYTTILAEYFQTRWEELAGSDSVLLVDFYLQGDPNVPGQITKLKGLSEQPDVLFLASEPDDSGPVVKQFRDAGFEQPIFGGDAYDTPLLVEVAGPVTDVYYTAPGLLAADAGTDMGKEFYKKYVDAFGHPPENAFAALGYDSVMVLAKAMEDAGTTEGAAVIAAIEKIKDMPAVAGNLSYGPSLAEHTPKKQVAIIRTVEGELTLASMYAPTQVPEP
jgi:branched-chain amino acid transport system substrate-binding protein